MAFQRWPVALGKEPTGLAVLSHLFQTDVCLMRDPRPAQMVQALLPASTPLVSLAAR